MKLGELVGLLQNSLGTGEHSSATYRIGVNIDEKDEYSLEYDCEYEYHIYVKFVLGVLSKVRVVHIANIYDDRYGEFLFYTPEKGLWSISAADGVILDAKELDIVQIDDIDEDLKNNYEKMLIKFKESRNKNKRYDDIEILPIDLIEE